MNHISFNHYTKQHQFTVQQPIRRWYLKLSMKTKQILQMPLSLGDNSGSPPSLLPHQLQPGEPEAQSKPPGAMPLSSLLFQGPEFCVFKCILQVSHSAEFTSHLAQM